MKLVPGDCYADDLEVLAHLGSGAFSEVYRARCPRYEHEVALKISHEPLRSTDTAQRALREVTIQRSLNSDHVARVHEHGLRPDGHFYVVMDLLVGKPLDEWWEFGQPLDAARALDLMIQVCDPLDQIHEQGIVHRDLKPGNIFVNPETLHTSLLDFGLARSWEEGEVHGITATLNHTLVGTPHYAQPEQLDGTPLTPAADVYSLATILYELLTGFTPLDAERDYATLREAWSDTPVKWISAHVRARVVPPEHHLSSCPPALSRAIMAALAKDAVDRPPRAQAWAAMLSEAKAAL